jgi:hypothetical protein
VGKNLMGVLSLWIRRSETKHISDLLVVFSNNEQAYNFGIGFLHQFAQPESIILNEWYPELTTYTIGTAPDLELIVF